MRVSQCCLPSPLGAALPAVDTGCSLQAPGPMWPLPGTRAQPGPPAGRLVQRVAVLASDVTPTTTLEGLALLPPPACALAPIAG